MGIVREELEERRISIPHGGVITVSSPQSPLLGIGAFDEGKVIHAWLYLSHELVGK
jgi:hypothetical protein